ncbi:MAG: sigma-70 family RNA polymerase sigma factor [Limisphaerales bacterium]
MAGCGGSFPKADREYELIKAIGAGDILAFEVLVKKYRDPVSNFIFKYMGDRFGAEDIAQEVFLRVYRAASEFEPRGKVSTWIFKIAYNLSLNMVDRFTRRESEVSRSRGDEAQAKEKSETPHVVSYKSKILLLPGSRADELRRHLPPMLGALKLIREKLPAAKAKMVLPDETLKQLANRLSALPSDTEIQIGNLPQALTNADVAIASTGTVTMECAFFGVPTVTLYKTSWSTYQIAKRIVKVKWLTMPNILADEEVFPEFVQGAATPDHIASAALELLQNEPRRVQIKKRLAEVVSSLGGPGANTRAATAILSLFN